MTSHNRPHNDAQCKRKEIDESVLGSIGTDMKLQYQ